MVGLQPDLLRSEYPTGETPKQAGIFINQFIAAGGDFPKGEFRALGWIHSSGKQWWSRMVSFVLEELQGVLVHSGLYTTVRVVQYVIPPEQLLLLRYAGAL